MNMQTKLLHRVYLVGVVLLGLGMPRIHGSENIPQESSSQQGAHVTTLVPSNPRLRDWPCFGIITDTNVWSIVRSYVPVCELYARYGGFVSDTMFCLADDGRELYRSSSSYKVKTERGNPIYITYDDNAIIAINGITNEQRIFPVTDALRNAFLSWECVRSWSADGTTLVLYDERNHYNSLLYWHKARSDSAVQSCMLSVPAEADGWRLTGGECTVSQNGQTVALDCGVGKSDIYTWRRAGQNEFGAFTRFLIKKSSAPNKWIRQLPQRGRLSQDGNYVAIRTTRTVNKQYFWHESGPWETSWDVWDIAKEKRVQGNFCYRFYHSLKAMECFHRSDKTTRLVAVDQEQEDVGFDVTCTVRSYNPETNKHEILYQQEDPRQVDEQRSYDILTSPNGSCIFISRGLSASSITLFLRSPVELIQDIIADSPCHPHEESLRRAIAQSPVQPLLTSRFAALWPYALLGGTSTVAAGWLGKMFLQSKDNQRAVYGAAAFAGVAALSWWKVWQLHKERTKAVRND